jgi:transposase
MTDEQINAAIADACGWTKINVEHRSGISPTNGLMMGAEFFPKYTKDLNAMHEAEKVLMNDWANQKSYLEWLGCEDDSMKTIIAITSATARQRAEAFLRTMGKWEEVQE